MSTASSSDAAGGSLSQVHTTNITQSQEEPAQTMSLDPSRIMLSMGFISSHLRAFTWVGALCKTVSGLKNMKAGFWSHIMVAVPLLIAILTLWPTFTSTADAKTATELAKWTARKDFIEFCQSVSIYVAETACTVLTMPLEVRLGARWV